MARSHQSSWKAHEQQVTGIDSSEQAVAEAHTHCLREERGWKEGRGSTEQKCSSYLCGLTDKTKIHTEVCLPPMWVGMQTPYSVELSPSASIFEGQGRVCRYIKCNTATTAVSQVALLLWQAIKAGKVKLASAVDEELVQLRGKEIFQV